MENIKFTLDDADHLNLQVPITKVDKQKRTVSGFATLNNVDKHGDIIDSEASTKAFQRFRGNIREMHMPVAVGKMVSFEERELEGEDGNSYKGIYVTARISKGAQDTWEKVVDGTLSGFSIGAAVLNKELVVKDDGTSHRVIKDYELFELSLVDSPANPLANVISIVKSDDGMTVSGIAVEAGYEDDEGDDMQTNRLENVLTRVADALEKFIGGKDMSDKADKKAGEEVDETVEKSEDTTVETKAVESDDDALVDSIVEKVLERLNESVETETDEVVSADESEEVAKSDDGDADEDEGDEEEDDDAAESELAKALNGINDTIKSLSGQVKEVNEKVDKSNDRLDEVSDRVEAVEDSGAVRKSADVDESEEIKKESFWGGAISGARYVSTDALDG